MDKKIVALFFIAATAGIFALTRFKTSMTADLRDALSSDFDESSKSREFTVTKQDIEDAKNLPGPEIVESPVPVQADAPGEMEKLAEIAAQMVDPDNKYADSLLDRISENVSDENDVVWRQIGDALVIHQFKVKGAVILGKPHVDYIKLTRKDGYMKTPLLLDRLCHKTPGSIKTSPETSGYIFTLTPHGNLEIAQRERRAYRRDKDKKCYEVVNIEFVDLPLPEDLRRIFEEEVRLWVSRS